MKEKQTVDYGRYINRLSQDELTALQRKKSIFLYLSHLMLCISLFLPVEGREKASGILWLSSLYVMVTLAMIVLCVVVSFRGTRSQKIRKEFSAKNAPRDGFKRATFFSFEVFNVLHFLLIPLEVGFCILQPKIFGILSVAFVVASAIFGLMARMVLAKANSGNVTKIMPLQPEEVLAGDLDVQVVAEINAQPNQVLGDDHIDAEHSKEPKD